MTDENEITTAVDVVETSVDIRNEVVVIPKIIETKPRDEFINLDNLNFGLDEFNTDDYRIFPNEINIL